jgi:RNA polymerase sigma factor (sigma-70 family)
MGDGQRKDPMNDTELLAVVALAQAGNGAAREAVVRAVQDDVFDLALRMLADADDARDASQDVLVRIVTKLGSFRGESKFRTWVYRVAANALLNFRGETRRREVSFAQAGAQLDAAIAREDDAPAAIDPARDTLLNEVKLACAHGMLLCLDRAHRLAYILGEVLELRGEEAAAVLDISPVAFRKRLSRAREEMEAFLRTHCGLADPANACRCAKLLPTALAAGVVVPERLALRRLPTREADRLQIEVDRIRTAAEIFRSLPKYASPTDFAEALRALLEDEDKNAN